MAVWEIAPLGDCGIVIRLGDGIDEPTLQRVQQVMTRLESRPFAGMVECVQAFASVTVFYDPWVVMQHATKHGTNHSESVSPYEQVRKQILGILQDIDACATTPSRLLEIPVCYGGEFGPDLEFVAEHNGLTVEEVIRIHTQAEYRVYMIGFVPGFPYLGGMSKSIAAPRKPTPRLAVPAGSVGIAGLQTGIYPIATPGGWQLIGRTPLPLFQPHADPPALLQSGDRIRFFPIDEAEFQKQAGGKGCGQFRL
jgi:inhibitor of KinA